MVGNGKTSDPVTGTAKLRILATTDLHMQMLGYDYIQDKVLAEAGLSALATLIKQARTEAEAGGRQTLLFDNGDFLQGTPLGDYLSRRRRHAGHPAAACLNAIGYDALGLGNHDFDFGLPYLHAVLEQCNMPAVCSNLTSPLVPHLKQHTLLQRPTESGDQTHLAIGVLSVIPAQTGQWNQNHLATQAQVQPPVKAIRDSVPDLRKAGADIVVVLAHMGIAMPSLAQASENQALYIASLDDVDAVIAGHTHLRFPGPDHAGVNHVDVENGTLAGTPAAMPGFGGSDLAVIDLDLARQHSKWTVIAHKTQLRPVTASVPPDATIKARMSKAHSATRRHLSAHVGTMPKTMHSYFALAQNSAVARLLGAAKMQVIAQAVGGGPLEHLPLLASASVTATGGMAGPDNFIKLNQGPVNRRQIAGLCPYVDQIWAVRATGRHVLNWLERAARVFNTLSQGCPDQRLNSIAVPGFKFDTILGLQYTIDPTQTSKFDPNGAPVPGGKGRIRDVSWCGAALDPEQEFLIATTHYRAAGSGGYFRFLPKDIVVQSEVLLAQALTDLLKELDPSKISSKPSWRFARHLGVQAVLHTSPAALGHLGDIAALHPEPCGTTANGYQKLRLTL